MLNFTVCAFTTLSLDPSLDANKPERRTGRDDCISESLIFFIQGKLLYVKNELNWQYQWKTIYLSV